MIVLIVGLGSIARKHVYALKQLRPEAEIYALRSGHNSEEVGGVKSITDINQLNGKPDFIIISNPTQFHADTIVNLLPLGVPLFIEKPLFDRIDNIQTVLKDIEESNLVTYVACNLRFHPCIRFVKHYLSTSAQRINEINSYCGSYLPDWRKGRDFREIYSAIPELGGGVHLDLIHELDYLSWLFGMPTAQQKFLRNSSSLEIAAVDYAHYVLDYDSFVASVTLNYFRRDAKRVLEIIFEDTTLIVDLRANTVSSNGEIIFTTPVDIYFTYIEQMRYFLQSVDDGQALMNDVREAYEILKIALK